MLSDELIYPSIFKYKSIIGYQYSDTKQANGFILFGYFNSTDPKQIFDIKKEGLNYIINISNYLNLQSNIFKYEIKGVKIIEIPNPYESGLYFVSNVTKNIIKKNDLLELNTEISLRFAYNGKLKKGNYFFKFAGILQEPTFDTLNNYSDSIFRYVDMGLKNYQINQTYKDIYDERRNINIMGRVALIQINILNDIVVFCDKKYDESAIKNQEGKYLTCGEGKFYDIENANEITQMTPGINYFFDAKKNVFIKCHEKCKTCSREYNLTNMNCDKCHELYFIRNDNCLEISKCKNNYYYDNNLELHCITGNISCPDFKPYENINTKECIENCNIDEFNNICNPTNNLIAINETKKKILENHIYLDLEKKLLKNKEKYLIRGNNVSFIFSTTEIEKKELNINYNSSTIILGECENILKLNYFLPKDKPIPILKIETFNNHSNNIDIYYELYNPYILSQKLNLNFCSQYYAEIRYPFSFKKYKMDLIQKTINLGYNIFDLNDSFYNDICSVFTYNNSDRSLSERKTLLDLSDEILCPNNCNYSNYDVKTLRIICMCKITNNSNDSNSLDILNDDSNVEKKDFFGILTNNIKNIDISKSSNIIVVKCFSIIFRKNLFFLELWLLCYFFNNSFKYYTYYCFSSF